MFLRSVLLAGVVVLITACGSQPLKVTQDPQAQQVALERLNAFRVTGGLGVWTDEESISTRIDWQQSGQDFNILVRLPAGLSSVQISQQDNVATVTRGGAAPVSGQSAARLLQQALGLSVAVPIEQMSLWMRGLPGASAESVTYDDQNRLATMNYQDSQATLWRAKVLKYTIFDNVYVPATIIATGGPYNIRLVLKEWSKVTLEEAAKPKVAAQTGTGGGRLKVPGR